MDNVASDQPLDVRWSGGGGLDSIVLSIHGRHCSVGPETLVLCHVANDGGFTVPQDILSKITWPNEVSLTLLGSSKVPIKVAELVDGPAWSVRALAATQIYWDADAKPRAQTCTSSQMAAGHVGEACADDKACGGGCCLRARGVYFTDNYCSLWDCSSDADCPSDAACTPEAIPDLQIKDYCAKRCTSDSDCRFPAYACLANGRGATVCRPNSW